MVPIQFLPIPAVLMPVLIWSSVFPIQHQLIQAEFLSVLIRLLVAQTKFLLVPIQLLLLQVLFWWLRFISVQF
jgi:uncharacterized membrane protein affecting hemolysin expression